MKGSFLAKLDRYAVYVLLFGLLAIFAIQFINGEENVFKIYDNLDSEITTRLLPIRNGNLFSYSNDELIPQMGIGFKRNSLNASAHSFESLLFYWLPPVYAYLLNYALINLITFLGTYLLFSRYLLRELKGQNRLFAAVLAFSFTLLPSYTIYGMAVLGAPMLTYCILNVLHGHRKVLSWIFILFYPFYSSLVLAGHVYVGLLFLTGVWYYIKKDKRTGRMLAGIALLIGLLYVVAEINLFNQFFFDKDFVSHRTDWDPTFDQLHQTSETVGFVDALQRSLDVVTKGEINAMVYPFVIILFLAFMLIFNFRGLLRNRYILPLVFVMAGISLLYGFYFSDLKPWVYLKNQSSLLKTFRIDRIFFFLPVMYYVLFALLIRSALMSGKKWMIYAAWVFLMINFLYVPFKNRELKANAAIFVQGKSKSMVTWKKFYAKDLFGKVKSDIGRPLDSYRTVSLGITPAVSLYNGFYTLDMYSNNYPLAHKRNFRRIIAPELEKSAKWKASFDKWGGECFLVTSEIEYRPEFIPNEHAVQHFEINTAALYELGGRYILSAVEIMNYRDINLAFKRLYTDPGTPLQLYLYEVLPPGPGA